ncbi:hypothetical protein ACLOJK_022561, partial [Asimina triloba]
LQTNAADFSTDFADVNECKLQQVQAMSSRGRVGKYWQLQRDQACSFILKHPVIFQSNMMDVSKGQLGQFIKSNKGHFLLQPSSDEMGSRKRWLEKRRGEILIHNKQHYKLMGKDVDVVSLIKLRVKEGKVVRHEDWWGKKPLRNRKTM